MPASRTPPSVRRISSSLLTIAVGGVLACAPSSPPETAPPPDTARTTAARPSAAAPVAVSPPPAKRPTPADTETRARRPAVVIATPPSVDGVARLSARNDTIAVRSLRAPVRVCAGGDVTLGTNLDTAWTKIASARMRNRFGMRDDPASLLAPLRPLVRESDVLLLNVESAVGSAPTPSKCGPRSTNCFAFRSPPAAAAALRALTSGVIVANIANNHARDAGNDGVDTTIAVLTAAGLRVTGADTIATPVATAAGDTIGVLGFYTSADTPDARDTAAVFRHVARAAQRFPVVIATMHLGAEGRDAQRTLDRRELYLKIDRGNPVAFADAAVRGGAALVIGHGPHVLRGIEWRSGGALIAYSLGNLLTYGPFVLKEPLDRGAILCATLDQRGRVRSASLTPTMQAAPGVLARDSSSRAITLVDSLSRLDFPSSGVRAESDGTLRARPRGN